MQRAAWPAWCWKPAPAVRDKLRPQGADIVTCSPETFARFVADQARKWARLIKQAKVTAE